jgi:energy-coupling factor transporter ATP-binding protein EcfA2
MYIHSFSIRDIKSFRGFHDDIPLRAAPGWYVLAGRNASGKTTLLKALAMAIAGRDTSIALEQTFSRWVTQGESTGRVAVTLLRDPSFDALTRKGNAPKKPQRVAVTLSFYSISLPPDPDLDPDPNAASGPWHPQSKGWFLCAYGAAKNLGPLDPLQARVQSDPKLSRLANLFFDPATLIPVEDWMREIARTHDKDDPQDPFSRAIEIINSDLIPSDLHFEGLKAFGLSFIDKRSHVSFGLKEISDGYRITAALVLDIIRHLYGCYGDQFQIIEQDGVPICDLPGVVLIDEIDTHMHISWQRRIGFWFRKHFPNIQFIVATHSPFICQAASPGGLILLPAPNDSRRIEVADEALYNTVVNGSLDDVILSALFGVDHPHTDAAEQKIDRLTALEVQALSDAPLSKTERDELARLRAEIPSSATRAFTRAAK